MLKLCVAASVCMVVWAQNSPLADRVDTTAFIQIEAKSFASLTPRQQALDYWLQQSAIAIDPIIYDQLSRFGLRQKRVLEAVVTAKGKTDPSIYGRILYFTKLFRANKGNHNETTAQKFLPKFTADELKRALEQAGHKDEGAENERTISAHEQISPCAFGRAAKQEVRKKEAGASWKLPRRRVDLVLPYCWYFSVPF